LGINKPLSKESNSLKADNFGATGSNFRTSSKDAKQASTKHLPGKQDPISAKKCIVFII